MLKKVLTVEKLNTYKPGVQKDRPVKILDEISLDVNENDIIGLVGETGSGKSVLINSIGKNLRNPLWMDCQKLILNFKGADIDLAKKDSDQMRPIWGSGIGFIPPNARDRLNPILTVGQQFSNIIQSHSKLSPKAARDVAIDAFKKVQMPAPERNYDSYPHTLSGGMAQRVLISVALFLSPRLLLADEPTMGLDVTIQKQVLDILYELIESMHLSVIIATRDMGIVANYCSHVAVLCSGQLVEFADKMQFFKNAMHPYSKYLLEAAFSSRGELSDDILEVSKTSLQHENVQGCRFSDRCQSAESSCLLSSPAPVTISKNHVLRCVKIKK